MAIFMRAERRNEWWHFHQTLSVDSYDRNTMSFKFGNDSFLTFEMPVILQKALLEYHHFVAILSICFRRPRLVSRFLFCFCLIFFEHGVRKTVIFKWKQPSVLCTKMELWYIKILKNRGCSGLRKLKFTLFFTTSICWPFQLHITV